MPARPAVADGRRRRGERHAGTRGAAGDQSPGLKSNGKPNGRLENAPLKLLLKLFPVGHLAISVLFIVAAFALVVFAGLEMWHATFPAGDQGVDPRLDRVLNSIALLTIAVAALELGQTIIEEEVQRESHMSAPSRVRRFLSRFLVVLVVALSIETLVAVFRFSRDDPSQLPYAAAVGFAAAALLAAWGIFVRLNQSAELLEPEALQAAKDEDSEVEKAR
jgi:hypothetical protein